MIYILECLCDVSCSDDEQPKLKPRSSLLDKTPQLIPAEDASFKSDSTRTLVVSWCIVTVKIVVEAQFCFFFVCRPANHTARIVRLFICIETLNNFYY